MNAIEQVLINGVAYPVENLIDKTLFARTDIKAYTLPNESSKIYGLYKNPQTVGKIYSWVHDGNKNLWWQFNDNYNRPYYVKHSNNLFSFSALKEQGILSTAEVAKKEAEAAQTLGDKLKKDLLGLTTGIKYVFIIAIILFVLFELNKRYNIFKNA